MSYQVLARKWRPGKFAELVGQEHVVAAITHALNNDRLHHAYLFTGTRGVGKTTIARIFSKSLNCEQGQSADPCGVCDTCVSIEQGNFVDLLEIDAASRTKVEDTRELLDNVQYKPTRGRYKVYLIDEVHMLSKHSFNALLKTLEEPPPHVKFLLATTDPQKLPVTILSRCLQFNLKALSREQIAAQLEHVLQQENIPAEGPALQLLARAAQGSMRDALSLTDQAIAQGNNSVQSAIVTDMLGLMDKQIPLKLLSAVIKKQQSLVMDIVAQLVDQSPDFSQVLSELSSLLHQIALTQWVPDACKLETTSARGIYELAKQLSPEHVQLLYKLVLEGKKELPLSVDGRTCLEMTLLRMMSFAPHSAPPEGRQQTINHGESHSVTTVETAPTGNHVNSVEQNPQLNPEPAPEPEPEPMLTQMDAPPAHMPEYLPDNPSLADHDRQVEQLDDQQSAQQVPDDTMAMEQEQAALEAEKNAASTVATVPAQSGLEKTQALLALRKQLSNKNEVGTEEGQGAKKSKPAPVFKPVVDSKPAVPELPSQPTPEPIDDIPPPWVTESVTDDFAAPETGVEQQPRDNEHNYADVQPSDNEYDKQTAESTQQIHHEVSEVGSDLQPFLPNGDKLIHAQQINSWSKLIESSGLGGLNKQIALNATFEQQGNEVQLLVDNSQSHLLSDASQSDITNALSGALGTQVSIEISLGEPDNTPHKLQQQINAMRQEYANRVVAEDETIVAIIQAFEATVDPSTVKAR